MGCKSIAAPTNSTDNQHPVPAKLYPSGQAAIKMFKPCKQRGQQKEMQAGAERMNQYGGSEGSSDETTQNSNGLEEKNNTHTKCFCTVQIWREKVYKKYRASDNPKMLSKITGAIKDLN